MQCTNPLSLPRPNGSGSKDRITVPCGKCYACLATRRAQWAFRLTQELKVSSSAKFITLTYDDDNLPLLNGLPCVSKRDFQLFVKRIRKALPEYKLRYFGVSEYGSRTYRPHYHFIFFNLPLDIDLYELITKTWKHGHIDIGSVTGASIAYVCKYCLSTTKLPSEMIKPFMLCSKRPAIGSNYLTIAIKKWHHENLTTYGSNQGFKVPLHRYYRDKIFTKIQKEKINLKMSEIRNRNEFENDLKYGSLDRANVMIGEPTMQVQKILDFISRQSKIIDKSNKI